MDSSHILVCTLVQVSEQSNPRLKNLCASMAPGICAIKTQRKLLNKNFSPSFHGLSNCLTVKKMYVSCSTSNTGLNKRIIIGSIANTHVSAQYVWDVACVFFGKMSLVSRSESVRYSDVIHGILPKLNK